LFTLISSGQTRFVQLGGTRTNHFAKVNDNMHAFITLNSHHTHMSDKRDDFWDVIDHGNFVAPMVVRISDVPILRGHDWWLVSPWYTRCQNRNSLVTMAPNTASLVIKALYLNMLGFPSFSIVHLDISLVSSPITHLQIQQHFISPSKKFSHKLSKFSWLQSFPYARHIPS